MRATLKLETEGTLPIEEVGDDTYQCGPRGTRDLYYRVCIECPADAMDERGFIVDAMEIHEVIRERWERTDVLPSCERMSYETARLLQEFCEDAHDVKVSLGTEEVAYMTATLTTRPDPLWLRAWNALTGLFRLYPEPA